LKKIAPDYYNNLPCHYSWVRVLYDFVRNPALSPRSRIRRTIRSDALIAKNAIDLKSKSKVNEILHDVIDNNNNHHTKHERRLSNRNRQHSKTE